MLGDRRYAAVLLDVDGVLVDTETAVLELWAEVCAALGRRPLDHVDRTHIVGCGVAHTAGHLFGAAGPGVVQEAHALVATLEPDLAMAPVDGAAALVHELAERDVPVVLVTGASRVRLDRIVDTLGIRGGVTAAVTAGEAEGKPHPGPYLLAARRAGAAPGECVVVEDADAGVRSAVLAGATCLGLAPAGGGAAQALRSAGADLVLASMAEVARTLRGLELGGARTDRHDETPGGRQRPPAQPDERGF